MSLTKAGLTVDCPPLTPFGWGVAAWGIAGVSLILLNPILRLGAQAAEGIAAGLTPVQWAAMVPWVGFMLYTEAWRGFHKQFSPRVVIRSIHVGAESRVGPAVLAPLMAMGLVYATPKRMTISWVLVGMILLLIAGVRLLPPDWRAVVDVGVVIGLAGGLLSLLWHTAQAARGRLVDMPSDLPWETGQ